MVGQQDFVPKGLTMTKKEWNKIRLQVVLGKKPDFYTILNKTGWCRECKYYKRGMDNGFKACDDNGCRSINILISTTDTKLPDHLCWKTGYWPKEFDDD